jgi:hypothetical protein
MRLLTRQFINARSGAIPRFPPPVFGSPPMDRHSSRNASNRLITPSNFALPAAMQKGAARALISQLEEEPEGRREFQCGEFVTLRPDTD